MKLFAMSICVACALGASRLGGSDHPALIPVLIELFTSEGCSSCPPADAFIQKLDTSQPIPGAQLIVLSEHVDYWNRDGWKDPYSSASFTERQGGYSHALGLKEVYTPQLIVNGDAEVPLDEPARIGLVFKNAAGALTALVRISAVRIEGKSPAVLRAKVEMEASPQARDAGVYVAVALDHAESQVLRGENKDKHLTHVAVLQSLKKIGNVQAGQSFSGEFQEQLKLGTDPKNIRIVAFVQQSGLGRIVGAGLLKPPLSN